MELGQHWFQSPATQQAIAWTNDDLSSTEPSEKKFREILNEIQTFPLTKMHVKM